MVGMSTDLPNEDVECAAYAAPIAGTALVIPVCLVCRWVGEISLGAEGAAAVAEHNREIPK